MKCKFFDRDCRPESIQQIHTKNNMIKFIILHNSQVERKECWKKQQSPFLYLLDWNIFGCNGHENDIKSDFSMFNVRVNHLYLHSFVESNLFTFQPAFPCYKC